MRAQRRVRQLISVDDLDMLNANQPKASKVRRIKRFLIPLIAATATMSPGLATAHHEGITGTEAWAGLAIAATIAIALVIFRKR